MIGEKDSLPQFSGFQRNLWDRLVTLVKEKPHYLQLSTQTVPSEEGPIRLPEVPEIYLPVLDILRELVIQEAQQQHHDSELISILDRAYDPRNYPKKQSLWVRVAMNNFKQIKANLDPQKYEQLQKFIENITVDINRLAPFLNEEFEDNDLIAGSILAAFPGTINVACSMS